MLAGMLSIGHHILKICSVVDLLIVRRRIGSWQWVVIGKMSVISFHPVRQSICESKLQHSPHFGRSESKQIGKLPKPKSHLLHFVQP